MSDADSNEPTAEAPVTAESGDGGAPPPETGDRDEAWYRDPNGPCGTTYNFSNGLAVTFTP